MVGHGNGNRQRVGHLHWPLAVVDGLMMILSPAMFGKASRRFFFVFFKKFWGYLMQFSFCFFRMGMEHIFYKLQ